MQTLTWPSPPALPDIDNGAPLALGTRFSLSQDAPIVGVEWRMPNTLPVSGSPDGQVALWTDAGVLLAFADLMWLPANAGQLVQFLFSAPFAATAATIYRASVFTRNRYVATTFYAWPQTTGIITATPNNGWFRGSAGFPDTLSGNAATYHVSPIIASVDGTLAATLPALTVALSGTSLAGGAIVQRPNTGTTTRPGSGGTSRPYTGVIPRP